MLFLGIECYVFTSFYLYNQWSIFKFQTEKPQVISWWGNGVVAEILMMYIRFLDKYGVGIY